MKFVWKEIAIAALFGLVMPGVILGIAASVEEPEQVIEVYTETATQEPTEPPTEPVAVLMP